MINYFDNTNLFTLIDKYKKHLGFIVLLAIIASFVFSGEKFIKPRFKSVMILYPVNIVPYGEESPTEQMIQLFRSTDIRQAILDKYSFAKKFNIDVNEPAGKSKLYGIYDDNIIISKTEFESVKVEVWDTNPDTAAAIAKDMIYFFNYKAKTISREKSLEMVKIYNDALKFKKVTIDSIEGRLKELREKYGILDYKAQSKEASKIYLEAMAKGNSGGRLNELNTLMNNLQQYGGEFVALTEMLKGERGDYFNVKSKRDLVISDATKELTYENIVTKPEAPDKKSYPVRWVIVLVSAISAFLLGLFILAIIDYKKRNITLG